MQKSAVLQDIATLKMLFLCGSCSLQRGPHGPRNFQILCSAVYHKISRKIMTLDTHQKKLPEEILDEVL